MEKLVDELTRLGVPVDVAEHPSHIRNNSTPYYNRGTVASTPVVCMSSTSGRRKARREHPRVCVYHGDGAGDVRCELLNTSDTDRQVLVRISWLRRPGTATSREHEVVLVGRDHTCKNTEAWTVARMPDSCRSVAEAHVELMPTAVRNKPGPRKKGAIKQLGGVFFRPVTPSEASLLPAAPLCLRGKPRRYRNRAAPLRVDTRKLFDFEGIECEHAAKPCLRYDAYLRHWVAPVVNGPVLCGKVVHPTHGTVSLTGWHIPMMSSAAKTKE